MVSARWETLGTATSLSSCAVCCVAIPTSSSPQAHWRSNLIMSLLAHRAVSNGSLPLAAMFAGLPPSSSEPTERKCVVPTSPPAHSSPLGLVLASLARFV
jgi:hypothetical protein